MSDERDTRGPQPRVIRVETRDQAAAPAAAQPRIIRTGQTGNIVAVQPAARVITREPAAPRPRRSFVRLGMAAIAIALIGGLTIQAATWLTDMFARGTMLGTLSALAVLAGFAGAGLIIASELKAWFRIKSVEAIQQRLSSDVTPRDIQPAIATVLTVVPRGREIDAGIEAFQQQVKLHHSSAQQVALLSQNVIRPLDRRAEEVVRAAVLRAVAITAISPTALGDVLFFVGVSLRMMRQIAECYGLRPTLPITVHLIRRLIREAGKLGAVDLAASALVQNLGGSALEWASSAAAESVYAAQRIGRLGIMTMMLCRPVPFGQDEAPSLTSLLGGLLRRKPDVDLVKHGD
jgi:putative membrane protein